MPGPFVNRLGAIGMVLWTVHLGLVIAGSLAPGDALPAGIGAYDKWLHFCGYLLLGFLPTICLRRTRAAILLSVLAVFLGAGLELAQTYVPGRSPELADAVANAAGVASGFVFAYLLRHKVL